MKSLEENVSELHQMILEGNTVAAMEKFYADEICMQENLAAPRMGKKVVIEHELKNLSRVKRFKAELLRSAINVTACVVFSEWKISYTDLKDQIFMLEEVSVQQWKNDKVIYERFYYEQIQTLN